jgi:two-component system sensor histidine kinase/response regulator
MRLDVNMPEMNGYEVCERLKSNETLADIPVIFLSALNETQDKVKAFRCGAVDYISKPFQFEEVHARVETHLQLREFQRALKVQNERLEEAVAARTRELAAANERLTILDNSKSEFLNLISHEFRTPLNGLLGIGELVLEEMPSTEESAELQRMFKLSRQRILSILDDALLLTQIDVNGGQFTSAPVSLHSAVSLAIDKTVEFANTRGVALGAPPADMENVLADEDLLVKALHSLLETVVRFSETGETVRLSRGTEGDSPRVIIESRGKTIPGSALAKFFDLFSIAEASTPGGDLGLGPSVAHRIISLFGGSVSVVNLPSGIRMNVSLPSVPSSPEET